MLKAEIAEFTGDKAAQLANFDEYLLRVKNPKYGDMYNAYNIKLYLNQIHQSKKALELAKREVENRPTPASYNFLAYSYLKLGNKEKALTIVKDHIEGKTFEPAILYCSAEIYKANGDLSKMNTIKKELLGAVYELGPNMKSKIDSL